MLCNLVCDGFDIGDAQEAIIKNLIAAHHLYNEEHTTDLAVRWKPRRGEKHKDGCDRRPLSALRLAGVGVRQPHLPCGNQLAISEQISDCDFGAPSQFEK